VNSITVGARSAVVGLFLVGMPLLALPQVGGWLQKFDITQLLPPAPESAGDTPPPLIATGAETNPLHGFAPQDFPGGGFSEAPQAPVAGVHNPAAFNGAATPQSSPQTQPQSTADLIQADATHIHFEPAPPLSTTPANAFGTPAPAVRRKALPRIDNSAARSAQQPLAQQGAGMAQQPFTHVSHTPQAAHNNRARNNGAGSNGSRNNGVRNTGVRNPASVTSAKATAAANQYKGQPWHRVAAQIQARLKALGAGFFELSQTGTDEYRCRCEIPLPATPVYRRPFEATAADSLFEMRLVLHEVEMWSAAKKPPVNAVYRQQRGA